MKFILFIAFASVCLFSCKKDDTPSEYNNNKKGQLSIEFDNIAGADDIVLNTGNYTNQSGENFTITKLKYYISNIALTKADGSVYTLPQDSCYFLIDESIDASHKPRLSIPEGEYKTLRFMIGVDSLRNTKDIGQRTGVLDPAGAGGDMYWGWNSGYIFLKMEGASAASTMMGEYQYHIGLYGGITAATLNNTRTITIDLTGRGTPKIKESRPANIHLMVDILKLFNGSTNFSIAAHPMVMVDNFSATIADNYTSMFMHHHTEQ